MRCDGVTRQARGCKRVATQLWLKRTGERKWATVKGFCTQHGIDSRTPGVMTLLRPFPWEVDRIVQVDSRSGFVVRVVADREENPSGTFTRDR